MDDNEKRLQRYLDEIAQETIGEDMNLWPEIRAQVEEKRAQQFRFAFGLGRVATVIFALLVVSTVGYAFYLNRGGSHGDAGLIGVSQAELTTSLELTQTINDVNVSLLWAYADGNRISLSYEVEYANTLDVPPLTSMELKDKAGNSFPGAAFLMGGGGGGGGGGGRRSYGSVVSYDATAITEQPSALDLTLIMRFGQEGQADTPSPIPLPEVTPSVGGGGGGGGGGGMEVSPEHPPEKALTPLAPFIATFDFSVPFIPALRFPEAQTVESGGLSITLQNVSIAPSVTLADLCFDVPDHEQGWLPRFLIGDTFLDGGNFAPNTTETQPDEPKCGQVALTALFKTDENPLTITIDRLQTVPDIIPGDESEEKIAAFVATLTSAGFEVVIDPPVSGQGGFGFSVTKFPDNLGDNAHDMIAHYYDDIFRDHIEGPWVFTYQLP